MKLKIIINVNKKEIIAVHKQRIVFESLCFTGKKSGVKRKQGDVKTPLGKYRVACKNPTSKYYLSLAINYPKNKDIFMGFILGYLRLKDLIKIIKGYLKNGYISWQSPLGGEIYIHGEGDEEKAWTRGCIKLSNDKMRELYELVSVGDRVIIKK